MILIINLATIVIVYVSPQFMINGDLEIGAMMDFIQYLATVLTSFLMLLVIILNIPINIIVGNLTEVEKIWDDQENYFKNHCRINHNVYTDSEGLSYNSITWRDEM